MNAVESFCSVRWLSRDLFPIAALNSNVLAQWSRDFGHEAVYSRWISLF